MTTGGGVVVLSVCWGLLAAKLQKKFLVRGDALKEDTDSDSGGWGVVAPPLTERSSFLSIINL